MRQHVYVLCLLKRRDVETFLCSMMLSNVCIVLFLIVFILHYSLLLSIIPDIPTWLTGCEKASSYFGADSLHSCHTQNEWLAFYSMFVSIHQSGVLKALFGCYMAGAIWNCCHLSTGPASERWERNYAEFCVLCSFVWIMQRAVCFTDDKGSHLQCAAFHGRGLDGGQIQGMIYLCFHWGSFTFSLGLSGWIAQVQKVQRQISDLPFFI